MSIHAADALMEIFGFKRVEEEEMDKVYETRRALFESWAITSAWLGLAEHPKREGDGYAEIETHTAWIGFVAALDGIAIDLPSIGYYSHNEAPSDCDSWIDDAKRDAIAACRKAIESTGLGLRIK